MTIWRRINRRFLIRYRIEYVVALALVYGVRALSPSFAWRGARRLGRLLFRLGVRKRVLLSNLALAFTELDERQRIELARRTMAHFASMFVDIIFQRRMLSRKNLYRRFEVVGWAKDYLEQHGEAGLKERARGILFLTAHFGNWELASGFFSLLGVRIAPVFRSPQNPYIAGMLRRIRLDLQPEFIERRGAVQAMLDRFERGGNVGFLFDQAAAYGIEVPFFGVPACTHKTPAVLARDHAVRIFFGVVVRRGDFLRYEARGELLDYDLEKDTKRITADLMHRLEVEIRDNPEQYLWMHRRFKRSGAYDGSL